MTESTPTKRRIGLRGWFWIIVGCMLGLPIVLFIAAAFLVNLRTIPARLEKTPEFLAAKPARRTAMPVPVPVARRLCAPGQGKEKQPSYSAFLEAELRDDPSLDGAKQYLALSRRFADQEQKKLIESFDQETSKPLGFHVWEPGKPLPATTAKWLRDNPDLVAAFLEFAEGPGLPARSFEMIVEIDQSIPYRDYFIDQGNRVMMAMGQLCIEENKIPEAVRYWRASIRMAVNQSYDLFGRHSSYEGLNDIFLSMQNLFDAGPDDETLSELGSGLDRLRREFYTVSGFPDYVRVFMTAVRKQLIRNLNQPWYSPFYGLYPNSNRYYFIYSGYKLPRIDVIVPDALTAMYDKQHSSHFLTEFDKIAAEWLRRAPMSWPELAKCEPFRSRLDRPGRMTEAISENISYVRMREIRSETRMNMIRAAIECCLTSGTQPEVIIDRESPWRDPFSNKALKTLETTSTLTIYSVGPDVQDQRAAIEYDPTNGVMSGGDLAGRVRRTRHGN